MGITRGAAEERTVVMAQRYAAGETLEAIGADHRLTRERVRQILKASGLVDAGQARAARCAAREAEDQAARALIYTWLQNNPGRTQSVAAQQLGIPTTLIGRLLGPEARRWFVDERDVDPVVPDEDVLAGLRQAAVELGDPLVADRYDTYAPSRGLLGSVRIIQRWGTWNAACVAAGLRINAGRAVYRRRWTEAEMLEHVANYLQTEDCRGSYAGYDDYARRVPEAPSSQTVRNAFGNWSNMKSAAQQIVAARVRRQRRAS